ncbi:MAG: PAS domain S-box protein [Candidatus Omnitrophica bacterium]|nr:PAS domain S-box protein [Candidatus Omnitrophota bacterium]
MIADFWKLQMDYVFFVYGLAFLSLCIVVLVRPRLSTERLPWGFLAGFGFLHGANEWLDMLAVSLGDSPEFKALRLVMMAVSFLLLIEFGRQGLKNQGARWPGYWIYIPLIAAVGCSYFEGFDGLNAACRYTLGFSGSVLTGLAFWGEASRLSSAERWPLRWAGVSFLFYSVFSGLIVPKAGFFPASFYNHDSFLLFFKFPVQIMRALCACAGALGIWFSFKQQSRQGQETTKLQSWIVPIMVAVILAVGFGIVNWRGQVADKDQRNRLISQGVAVARTINTERVKALSFSSLDRSNPNFLRLREQMIAYGNAMGLKSIYSMAIRDGHIVFGPENIPENSSLASPPGTVYQEPRREDWEAFKTGRPYTVGPVTDEYGTFVSAGAPVIDSHTGQGLLIIGMDINADLFQAFVTRARLEALYSVFLIVIFFLGGIRLLAWREEDSARKLGPLRYAEAWVTAGVGLIFTIAIVSLVHDEELRSHRQAFWHLAEAQTGEVIEAFSSVRDHELGGLAYFFRGSQSVEPEEYKIFAGPQAMKSSAFAWEWVAAVPADSRERFEAEARQQGAGDFTIYEKNAEGLRVPAAGRPVYYPVRYVEPLAGKEKVLGFDLGSEPGLRAGLEMALRTRLVSATDVIAFPQEGGTPGKYKSIFVFDPVFKNEDLKGFAVVILRPLDLLRQASYFFAANAGLGKTADVDLYQLETGKTPLWLGSSLSKETAAPDTLKPQIFDLKDERNYVCPLFMFGKSYALVVHSQSEAMGLLGIFSVSFALIGLVLTLILALFIRLLINRKFDLERDVLVRTTQLRNKTFELEHERHNLQIIFDSADVGFLLLDETGLIKRANNAIAALIGRDTLGMLLTHPGEALCCIHSLKDKQRCGTMTYCQECPVHNLFLRVLREGGVVSDIEAQKELLLNEKPRSLWLKMSGSLLEMNGARHVLMSFFDITERKLLENDILESRARLQLALRSARMGTWSYDSLTKKRYFDPQTCKLLGIDFAAFSGEAHEFFNVLHPDDKERVKSTITGAMEKKETYQTEYRVVWPDKSVHYIASRGRPTFSEDGLGIRMDGVIWDETESKEAAQEIVKSEERLRMLFKVAPDAVFMHRQDTITYVNTAALELFGAASPEDLVGHSIWDRFHPDCHQNIKERIRKMKEEGGAAPIKDQKYLRIDGSVVDVEVAAVSIFSGEHKEELVFVRNITQRKQAEAAILKAKEEAEAASRAKSEFLSNMSHEIRTPMNSILGFGHLLRHTSLNEKQKNFINAIMSSGSLLLNIINDILDLSKVSAGKMVLEESPFNLHQSLMDALRITEPQVKASVSMVTEIDEAASGIFLGDSVRLRQVLINLLGNAAKFTSRGSIVLSVRCEGTDGKRARFLFSVRDTGVGIPESKLKKIFEPFVQADMSITRQYGGTGLGLSIAKSVVEIMGGEFLVRSKPGEGSEFSFSIWLKKPDHPKSVEVVRDAQGVQNKCSGTCILVAEDNAANQELIKEFVSVLGCEADYVVNGQEAVDSLRKNPGKYDMCFMDIQMPVMGGIEATKIIRDGVDKDFPIIALTAAAMVGEKERLMGLGMTDYLAKPVLIEALRDKITQYKRIPEN